MRFVETMTLQPVRLVEHPGHPDQKIHGRRGAGGGDSMDVGIPANALAPGTKLVFGDGLPFDFEDRYPGQSAPRGQTVISPDDPRIPDTVYHVTTNLPAVLDSGFVDARGSGGLGGDKNDRIVSMTTDRDVAVQLAADIRDHASIQQSTSYDQTAAILTARADQLGIGTQWRDAIKLDPVTGKSPEFMRQGYGTHDLERYYYSVRQTHADIRNPIFMGTSSQVNPANVGIVAIPKKNLDNGALLVDFDLGRNGLEEIRSYGDVSLAGAAPLTEARLLEHPGHPDQKVHGRKGAGMGDAPEEYRGQHSAPGPSYGEPMHDLGNGELIPADIRNRSTQMQYYGTGMPVADRESFAAVNAALEGGPNTPITVYRAVPEGVKAINPGDWVTPSRTYAEIHAAGNLPAGVKGVILTQTVKAKTLYWDGNSINEWGYNGPRLVETRLLEHPGHADQKVHGRRGVGAGVSKERLDKLDAELRTIRDAERIVAIHPKTGAVTLDMSNAGTQILLDHKADLALRGTIATHNHPLGWEAPEGTITRNGNAFSQDDLNTAWRAGVAEMRVAAPGSTYTVKNKSDDTWGTVTEMGGTANGGKAGVMDMTRTIKVQELDAGVRAKIGPDVSSGRLTPEQASFIHGEVLLHDASVKFGWEYTIERTSSYVDPGVKASDYFGDSTPNAVQNSRDLWNAAIAGSPTAMMALGVTRSNGPNATLGESFAEAIALQVVRLLEHPGHGSQKVHGRRSSVDVTGQQLANISAKTRAKMDARAKELGLPSVKQMAAKLGKDFRAASDASRESGMEWYENAHKQAVKSGGQDGFSLNQEAAVIAHMSSQRGWETNGPTAMALSRVMGKRGRDVAFEVTAERGRAARPPVKAGMYKVGDLNPSQVAWLHPDLSPAAIRKAYNLPSGSSFGKAHYDQIGVGVEVFRGTKTPDEVLGGPKTRSFHNNIYDPKAPYVTVDDWAVKSALGTTPVTVRYSVRGTDGKSVSKVYEGPANEAPYGTVGAQLSASPKASGESYEAGLYPLVAEAFSVAASKAGVLPQQMQAVIWESSREKREARLRG